MLLGRSREREELDHLIGGVHAGESRALVLRGEAGIGKTVLLDYARGLATGSRVVRVAGVEAERELAFAGLHQVCAPMLDRLEHLPAPQREVLAVAFGLSAGNPPDRFKVGLAVLGLFADVAQEQPLVVLIDDAHWLDSETAQVLGFVARRLRAESVGMIFAVRGDLDLPDLAGLPELSVTALTDADARALLALVHAGPVDDLVRERIIAESQGNPLALLELPRGFTPAELAGGFGLLSSVALPRRIEESFRRQIATLSPATRQVLLLAAAEPVGDPVLVWRAADRLGIAVDSDLASREVMARFLELGSRVTFRHPLLRSAVYRAATPEDRREAHRALADVTDPVADPDRRAWHRAQAVVGPDEEVAAELEDCAERAQARGGPAAAAALLERAAELTPDLARRGRRLLAASQAKYEAGMAEAARRLLAQAEASPLDSLERAQVDLARGRLAFTLNRGPEAPRLLLKSAAQFKELDVQTAQQTYLEALQAGWFVAHLTRGPDLHGLSAAAVAALPRRQPLSPLTLLLDGLATRYRDGYPAGAPMLKQALAALLGEKAAGDMDLRRLWFACTISLDLWEDDACEALTYRFVDVAQRSGTLTPLPLALTLRIVMRAFTGDLATASSLLEEFEAVREGTGLNEPPYAAQLVAVWRGHEDEASALIESTTKEATERGEGVGLIAAGWMRALLFNSLGRYDDALRAAQEAVAPVQEMGVLTGCSLVELVTAASHLRQRDLASEAVARLRAMTQASGTNWALGVQAGCEALVSRPDTAEAHYRESIDRLQRTRIRGELARTHLHYGEWLRRHNRRGDAREELRVAHTMFAAMGMEAFAARAARELGATGETVRKRSDASSSHQLTPQETQIVKLVRGGLSNAEIGERLFISPRTVEWHLSKIFTKLGVSSRRRLRPE
jgi:DNA-binding CsgD family transcriptional regulator